MLCRHRLILIASPVTKNTGLIPNLVGCLPDCTRSDRFCQSSLIFFWSHFLGFETGASQYHSSVVCYRTVIIVVVILTVWKRYNTSSPRMAPIDPDFDILPRNGSKFLSTLFRDGKYHLSFPLTCGSSPSQVCYTT